MPSDNLPHPNIPALDLTSSNCQLNFETDSSRSQSEFPEPSEVSTRVAEPEPLTESHCPVPPPSSESRQEHPLLKSNSIFKPGLDPQGDSLPCSLDAQFANFENTYRMMQKKAKEILMHGNTSSSNSDNDDADDDDVNDLIQMDIGREMEQRLMSQSDQSTGVTDSESKFLNQTESDFSEIKVIRDENQRIRITVDSISAKNESNQVDGTKPLLISEDGKCVLPWCVGSDGVEREVDWGSDCSSESDNDCDIDFENFQQQQQLEVESKSQSQNLKDYKIYYQAARRIYRHSKKRGLIVKYPSTLGPQAGCGLFTTREFKKGETIMYYDGRIICKEIQWGNRQFKEEDFETYSSESNSNTDKNIPTIIRRVFNARKQIKLKMKNSNSIQQCPVKTQRSHRFLMELDVYHDMDGGTGGPEPYANCLAAYSNSCLGCSGNLENVLPITDHSKGLGPRAVRYVATRDIKPGEELLWEYRFQNEKNRSNNEEVSTVTVSVSEPDQDENDDPVFKIYEILRQRDNSEQRIETIDDMD